MGSFRTHYITILLSLFGLALLGLAFFLYQTYTKLSVSEDTQNSLRTELSETKKALDAKTTEAATLSKTIEDIRQAYALSEENGAELLNQLTSEKNRNDAFAEQLNTVTGTVHTLDKLAKTDEELLKKYSKIYFLNEHYMPGLVEEVSSEFLTNPSVPEHIHKKVAPFLEDLLQDAQADGIDLRVVSAYRSFDEQKALKSSYTVQYGTGANAFSADQGYSEHQLGTTVDFSTKALGGSLDAFEQTEAYTWLQNNAHKYGFVLSYPKNNAYYVFEPWHWRYVGTKLATDLNKDGAYFYDWDQRKIDEYLISLFD